MMTLSWCPVHEKFEVFDGNEDADGAIRVGGLRVTANGQERLRAALSVPDAAAEARAKLEQARVDNIIGRVLVHWPGSCDEFEDCWGVQMYEFAIRDDHYVRGETEAEALSQAAAHVETLRQQREATAQEDAERAAIAAAEARIMAAHHAGLIEEPVFPTQANNGHWRYYVRAENEYETPSGCSHVAQVRDIRLAAATAAAEWCETLTPVLPDVEAEREAATLFGGAPARNDSAWEIGKNYLIRAVTLYQAGRLVAVHAQELVLESASWVADIGKVSEALRKCDFNEVEMFPPGPVIVGRGAIVDAIQLARLPEATK